MDPTYATNFEYGKGLKLFAGNTGFDGFLGHLANSEHPLHKFPKQNARLDMQKKFSMKEGDRKINRKLFSPQDYGFIPLIASKDIKKGEEIIIDYGLSYWLTIEKWLMNPREKSWSCIQRDLRRKGRNDLKLMNAAIGEN